MRQTTTITRRERQTRRDKHKETGRDTKRKTDARSDNTHTQTDRGR